MSNQVEIDLDMGTILQFPTRRLVRSSGVNCSPTLPSIPTSHGVSRSPSFYRDRLDLGLTTRRTESNPPHWADRRLIQDKDSIIPRIVAIWVVKEGSQVPPLRRAIRKEHLTLVSYYGQSLLDNEEDK